MEGSVSEWLNQLKAGDAEAARRLWERYAQRLVHLAGRRIPPRARGRGEQDDIVQSVFISLCQGAKSGRLQKMEDRDDLWWFLLALTRQKIADRARRDNAAKRGGGKVMAVSDVERNRASRGPLRFEDLVSDEPTPEFLVMLDEEHRRLLALLRDDELRRVAVWRVEGYTVDEIADRLEITPRTVKRKMRLIRDTWENEVT